MTNDTRTALIENLTANPRQTAVELGITIADAKVLEADGVITNFGTRVTGKRGRPPIEWVVAGAEVSDTQQEVVQAAEGRVSLVKRYDRICNRMWRLREAGERGSDEYNRLADEKAAIYEVTGGIAPEAKPNDYALAGEVVADVDTPLDVPELVAA